VAEVKCEAVDSPLGVICTTLQP